MPSRISRWRSDPAIARCGPFALFIALLVLGSHLSSFLGERGASDAASWFVVARGAIVALALAWFWPAYIELRKPSPAAAAADWLLAALAGFAVFLVWIGFDQDWAVLSRSVGFIPHDPEGGTDWFKALARLAGFALVVPVMEELFWRSFLLRWLEQRDFLAVDPRRVGIRALLVTTVLFSLEHDRWLAGAVAGMVYSGLYMRSGNLWVPIAAHAVTNAVLGGWILTTHNWQFW
jgi:CAAX prenyl protease-like protein